MDQNIFVIRDPWWYFSLCANLNRTFCKETVDPDQTPRSAASDLGLYCLHISHKKGARFMRVKRDHYL